MPIRPEYRKYYQGPDWEAIRQRVLTNAKHRCQNCKKPNGAAIYTYTWQTAEIIAGELRKSYHMVWAAGKSRRWRDQRGAWLPEAEWPAPGLPRRIRAQIGVAHLDSNPRNNSDSNLRALCTWCHLQIDTGAHKQTRQTRRDRARPLIAALEAKL